MKTKFVISLALLLFVIGCFPGCTNQPQRVIRLGVEEMIEGCIPFTVTNDSDNSRFSVAYSEKNTNVQGKPAFFTFTISSEFGENVWSTYKYPDGNSVLTIFSFTDSDNGEIDFEDGAHEFFGEKTIYISYDSAPEKIKDFCKAFSAESGNNGDAYSIYINGYRLTGGE